MYIQTHLELEMLVVQTYTTESGVCSTCFVTALSWNKDRLLHQPPETCFLSYMGEASVDGTSRVMSLPEPLTSPTGFLIEFVGVEMMKSFVPLSQCLMKGG